MEEIGATANFEVEVGDVLTILTPGGGGFGAAGDGGGGSAGGELGAANRVGLSGGNVPAEPDVVGAAGNGLKVASDDQRASRRRST
jgi:hypothetical protein